MGDTGPPAPLRGRRVVTTRERPGALDEALERLGATVLHVPLIATTEAADGGAALRAALADIASYDWVVVTSPNGAERAASALVGAKCRIAAVGTRTADVVAEIVGRPVDLVPDRQTAADLVAAMPPAAPAQRLLLTQADRAAPTAAVGLGALGYRVDVVTAYRTVSRPPTDGELAAAMEADAVAFASGSAVEAWVEAIGRRTPPFVAVIGPSTEAAALDSGIKVSVVAADHSIEGLTAAILRGLGGEP